MGLHTFCHIVRKTRFGLAETRLKKTNLWLTTWFLLLVSGLSFTSCKYRKFHTSSKKKELQNLELKRIFSLSPYFTDSKTEDQETPWFYFAYWVYQGHQTHGLVAVKRPSSVHCLHAVCIRPKGGAPWRGIHKSCSCKVQQHTPHRREIHPSFTQLII